MRVPQVALIGLAATLLGGCSVLEALVPGSAIAPLEVWNTTLEPVFLVDEDGRRIDVPACGHVDPMSMRLDAVRVHTERGYVYGFGTRPNGAQQYLVIVAADGESDLTTRPPISIPPCQGRPNAQPGV